MGKEKLYISATEWSNKAAGSEGGMRFGGNDGQIKETFRGLPFYCCSLSLQPFEMPMAAISDKSTSSGQLIAHIFDLTNIVPWLRKHDNKNPVTGEKLTSKDLIKLEFARNDKGDIMDPVTFKVFNENTHVVFIRQTGNVYAMDTLQELCLKPKNLKDLLTDEPFTKKDIICIQDPHSLSSRNMTDFFYVKNDLKPEMEKDTSGIRSVGGQTNRVLKELEEKKIVEKQTAPTMHTSKSHASVKESINAAHFSTGRTAASFTSTSVMNPVTKTERFMKETEDVMFEDLSKKGSNKKVYITLQTNYGPLNLELWASITPRTVYNFVQLCKQGKYDNVAFHRNIAGFMIQGGDPTGTGKGGESCWGKDFVDEIRQSLKHDKRGLLSMANRGKNTNSSQFFITYGPAKHLDGKHTIFGQLVGGWETLNKIEFVETNDKDRPLQDIVITATKITNDSDVFEQWEKQKEGVGKPEKVEKPVAVGSGVGKYLKREAEAEPEKTISKKPKTGGFNFDNW